MLVFFSLITLPDEKLVVIMVLLILTYSDNSLSDAKGDSGKLSQSFKLTYDFIDWNFYMNQQHFQAELSSIKAGILKKRGEVDSIFNISKSIYTIAGYLYWHRSIYETYTRKEYFSNLFSNFAAMLRNVTFPLTMRCTN